MEKREINFPGRKLNLAGGNAILLFQTSYFVAKCRPMGRLCRIGQGDLHEAVPDPRRDTVPVAPGGRRAGNQPGSARQCSGLVGSRSGAQR